MDFPATTASHASFFEASISGRRSARRRDIAENIVQRDLRGIIDRS